MAKPMVSGTQASAREMRVQEALREALRYEMARDERVFVMGEDVALFGGAYGVTRGLMQEFGERRVLDTPISESALVGLAVGAAVNGMRPVVEIQSSPQQWASTCSKGCRSASRRKSTRGSWQASATSRNDSGSASIRRGCGGSLVFSNGPATQLSK